jgi:hypothetical protein
VAQSLHRVRELIGADLDDQVKEATREFEIAADVVAQGPHLDKARLRGIPAVGAGTDGAIAGSNPTDWIDMMDDDEAAA